MNSFCSVGGELVPRLEHLGGPRRERRVLRHEAESLLVGEDLLAELLVAAVEQVHGADPVHPFLRRVVRRVRGAGRVLDEDRLARVDLVHPRHVVDRVVRHLGDEVPRAGRGAVVRVDLGRVAEQVRLPLVGVAADEAVEVLEAHAGRPVVERPDLAGLEGRHVVVLAEPGGVVAVVDQHPPDRGLVLADDAVVAGIAGGLLGDDAEADRVVIAPGDQRGAGRRTERRGEHPVVAEAFAGNAIHGRRRDHAAERARHAEPGVVGDDQQHVGRALRWDDAGRPPRRGLQRAVLDDAAELRLREPGAASRRWSWWRPVSPACRSSAGPRRGRSRRPGTWRRNSGTARRVTLGIITNSCGSGGDRAGAEPLLPRMHEN